MSFTDDDLKRLKEFIKETRKQFAVQLAMNDHKLYDEIEALIVRTEATEKLCNYLNGFDDVNNPIVSEYLKAWRKSKGEK